MNYVVAIGTIVNDPEPLPNGKFSTMMESGEGTVLLTLTSKMRCRKGDEVVVEGEFAGATNAVRVRRLQFIPRLVSRRNSN